MDDLFLLIKENFLQGRDLTVEQRQIARNTITASSRGEKIELLLKIADQGLSLDILNYMHKQKSSLIKHLRQVENDIPCRYHQF